MPGAKDVFRRRSMFEVDSRALPQGPSLLNSPGDRGTFSFDFDTKVELVTKPSSSNPSKLPQLPKGAHAAAPGGGKPTPSRRRSVSFTPSGPDTSSKPTLGSHFHDDTQTQSSSFPTSFPRLASVASFPDLSVATAGDESHVSDTSEHDLFDDSTAEDDLLVLDILRAQPDEHTLNLSNFVDRLNIRVLWRLSRGTTSKEPRNSKHSRTPSQHRPETPEPNRVLKSISLAGWQSSTATLLRSMAIIPGDFLERIDLSRTQISNRGFAALLTHCHRLAHLDISQCSHLKSSALEYVSIAARKTLVSINMSGCPHMCKDALMWLAGAAGAGGSGRQCRKLRTVDISHCEKISDAGVAALTACKRLKCLNVLGCSRLTDRGVSAFCRGSPQLLLLNLSQCFQITDTTLFAIGKSCAKLQSLLLTRCHRISDKGLVAVGKGCPRLQTLYVNGCFQVTELGLAEVAQNCRNLLYLNVTGCENITDEGLHTLCRGLKYVKPAKEYYGFEPKDNARKVKMRDQWQFIEFAAAQLLQAQWRGVSARNRVRSKIHDRQVEFATRLIQRVTRGMLGRKYCRQCRRAFNRTRLSSMAVQTKWRQLRGKREADQRRWDAALQRVMPLIVRMQAKFRGDKCRHLHPEVPEAMLGLKEARQIEIEAGVLVRVQRFVRQRAAQEQFAALIEEFRHRKRDEILAITKVQALGRMRRGKRARLVVRETLEALYRQHVNVARRLQAIYRGRIGRRVHELLQRQYAVMLDTCVKAAINIQRMCRGLRARRVYARKLRLSQLEYSAAKELQKIFRGRKILRWRQVRLQLTLQRAKEAAELDLDRAGHAIVRREMFADSASEDDSDGDFDWTEHFDDQLQVPFWWSPSRGERRDTEPVDPHEYNKGFVGETVRVNWPGDTAWYDGKVTKYNAKKKRHKIEYVDGDAEWLDLHNEHKDRVQLWTGTVWCMFRHIKPGWRETRDANERKRQKKLERAQRRRQRELLIAEANGVIVPSSSAYDEASYDATSNASEWQHNPGQASVDNKSWDESHQSYDDYYSQDQQTYGSLETHNEAWPEPNGSEAGTWNEGASVEVPALDLNFAQQQTDGYNDGSWQQEVVHDNSEYDAQDGQSQHWDEQQGFEVDEGQYYE